MKKKLFIKTYGCQANVYDSIRMQDLLEPFGYEKTEDMEEADMVILNTCHIREKASEKTYSELGRVNQIKKRREKADPSYRMMIVVAGCVAQGEGEEIFARAPYVDIVVGPQSYHSLPKLINQIAREDKKHLIDLDFVEEAKFDKLPETNIAQGPSAFISIQEGCDKFCAFCVVPYTRGAEFSRPIEQIYREALKAVSFGAREIHLLGQNVSAYHGKTPEGKEADMADLISYIAAIPDVARIRYTTSHPMDMTDKLLELHGSEPKLMPFLHLPIQSGSNKILKAMNRKHDREFYLNIIAKLKKIRPDIVLSSDFIVGFPGETDEDFADTVDIVRQVGYGQCYSFKYSPRPGTPAATKDQVPEDVKTRRLQILQEEIAAQQIAFNKSCVGEIMPVLFERPGKLKTQIIGKTPYMQSVHIEIKDEDLQGQIREVKITEGLPSSLTGILI